MQRKLKWKIALVLLVVAISLLHALPLKEKIRLGLDLSGGMHLVLRVDTEALEPGERKDATERALEIIRNRIDQFGVAEPSIQRQGKDRIIIQLPGVTDRQRALDLIGKTALLEFKIVSQETPPPAALEETVPVGYELKTLEDERIYVQKAIALKGENLTDAYVGSDQFGGASVDFELSATGARIFARVTEQNIGRRLAILLDGNVYSAPQIQSSIPGGRGQITGRFSYDEARDLAIVLRAGALPAPVRVEEERTVGPTLGQDSVDKGVRSCLIGLVLVFVLMILFFGWAGLIADLALTVNILVVLAALAYFKAALTLPGIAGLILTIGMGVDANVIIYERIREEIRKGSAIRSAIQNGYKAAFRTIVDANVTTLVTALILYNVGSGPIKGFAVTLSVGILASMFTAIFATHLIFDLIAGKGPFRNFPMHSLFGRTRFNFVGHRRIAYAASCLCILLGIGVFTARGASNFGIDFSGGELQQIRFRNPVHIESIRGALVAAGLGNLPVQHFGGEREVIVRSPLGSEEKIRKSFEERFEKEGFDVVRVETVGPAVGQELRWKALKALGLSLLAICAYITVRFRFDFSIAAILALLHDCLITVGLFSLAGRELNLPMIAALLTIMGYSLNDTIVIFDRIRENLHSAGRKAYDTVINESLNQTLSRTVLTSVTTIAVVAVLFVGGGKVINDFAFALLIGAFVGTYSSIYVASSVLVTWNKRKRAA